MGKTYSKKQKWIEANMAAGVGRPVFGNMDYRLGNGPHLGEIEEKLCRHPGKKSKKCNLRREYIGNTFVYCVGNPCGDIYERSSRLRLAKFTQKKIRRTKCKANTLKEINDVLNEY